MTAKTTLNGRQIIDLIEKNSLKFVADLAGVTPKTVRDRLLKAGFEMTSQGAGKPSKWSWNKHDQEPSEPIFELDCEIETVSEGEVEPDTTESEGEVNVNSPTVHTQFTREELTLIIQETVKAMNQAAPATAAETEPEENIENVYERIRVLPMDNKTRKTIVINEGISIKLDQFCHDKKLNKSDVIHLALKELFLKEGV